MNNRSINPNIFQRNASFQTLPNTQLSIEYYHKHKGVFAWKNSQITQDKLTRLKLQKTISKNSKKKNVLYSSFCVSENKLYFRRIGYFLLPCTSHILRSYLEMFCSRGNGIMEIGSKSPDPRSTRSVELSSATVLVQTNVFCSPPPAVNLISDIFEASLWGSWR